MRHFETLRFRVIPNHLTDVIVALLAQEGFDGFLQEDHGWTSTSRPENPSKHLEISEIIKTLPGKLEWSTNRIEEQNWNAAWEESFPIIDIGDAIRIRAPFHEKNAGNREEFELEPNMAFGTGHHPTTFLMAKALQTRCKNKICLDFGTGTGILAMIMLRFGAVHVTAIDNDERAVQTAKKHIETEKCSPERSLVLCTSTLPEGPFDLIAANIHLNVIVEELPEMVERLNPGAEVLISGILENQLQTLLNTAEKCGFFNTFKESKEGWVCLSLKNG